MAWTNFGLQRYLNRGIGGKVSKIRIRGNIQGGTTQDVVLDTKTVTWDGAELISGVNMISQWDTTILDVPVSGDDTAVAKVQLLGDDDAVLFDANVSPQIIFSANGTVSVPKLLAKYTQNTPTITI